MNNEALMLPLITIILLITARVLISKLLHTDRSAARFWLMAGLFLLYTLTVTLSLRQVCLQMIHLNATIQEYHKAVIVTICAINIAIMFLAITYHFIQGKHKLSSDDKMKLMDL